MKCKFQSQGELTTISDLRLSTTNAVLHVRVSRMWEFRVGGNEKGNIKHLDLVLIDQKVFPSSVQVLIQTKNMYMYILTFLIYVTKISTCRVMQSMLKYHQM